LSARRTDARPLRVFRRENLLNVLEVVAVLVGLIVLWIVGK
jgi:hypothetical protein